MTPVITNLLVNVGFMMCSFRPLSDKDQINSMTLIDHQLFTHDHPPGCTHLHNSPFITNSKTHISTDTRWYPLRFTDQHWPTLIRTLSYQAVAPLCNKKRLSYPRLSFSPKRTHQNRCVSLIAQPWRKGAHGHFIFRSNPVRFMFDHVLKGQHETSFCFSHLPLMLWAGNGAVRILCVQNPCRYRVVIKLTPARSLYFVLVWGEKPNKWLANNWQHGKLFYCIY